MLFGDNAMMNKKTQKWLGKALVVFGGIGAVAWGLLAFLNFDLVGMLPWAMVQSVVYGLVAAGGLVILFNASQN